MKGSEGQFELAKYDKQYLNDLSCKSDIFFQEITVDDTDVRHLSSFIKSELENFSDQTGQERWKDFGYWLLYPIALLTLFWFRRGWIVRWLE